MTVVLHSTFQGDNAASTPILDTTETKTLTFVAGADIRTDQFKFGASSLRTEGLGEVVTAPDSADVTFGSGAFTVACWVRAVNFIGNVALVAHYDTTLDQREWLLYSNSAGELAFAFSTNGTDFVDACKAAMVTTGSVWTFLAADHDGAGNLRCYQDGTMLKKSTGIASFNPNSTSPFSVGARGDGSLSIQAHIGEVYVNKGEALWASDGGFTTPTAPLFTGFDTGLVGVATPQYRSLLLDI